MENCTRSTANHLSCSQATMSSVEYLRGFVNERLTVAAEEIFGVLKRTIVEYEEEIDRQRRLLDIVWKPTIKLRRIELSQQPVCTEEEEEEVLTDQQLCIQQRNISLDQEEPEPPLMKEEQEELCTNQDGEHFVPKEEAGSFLLSPTYEESEDQTLNLSMNESQTAAKEKLRRYLLVKSSVVSEPNHAAESPDQKGDSESTGDAQTQHHKSRSGINNVNDTNGSKKRSNTHMGKQSFKCETCGKIFKYKSQFCIHRRFHTGEKPYLCNTCGKRFCHSSALNAHVRIHTGEKPFGCNTCGRRFSQRAALTGHQRIHTGEKPYSCQMCGKFFRFQSCVQIHMKVHTGKKVYICKTCGKKFSGITSVKRHIKDTHGGLVACIQ